MATHDQSVVEVSPKGTARRQFSKQFKRELVQQTLRPDVSLAAVALANGINTNLLSRWRREFLRSQSGNDANALVPVHVIELPPPSTSQSTPVMAPHGGEVQVQRGDTVITVRGVPDAAILGMVLRELLQSPAGAVK